MPADHVIIDRYEAISEMSADRLAAVLSEMPYVVGRLTGSTSKRKLATDIADDTALLISAQMVSPQALQLMSVAMAYGGSMSEAEVASESEPLTTERRGQLLHELADRLIIDPTRGYLVLRPGFERILFPTGLSLRDAIREGWISAETVVDQLKLHGVQKPPTGRQDRLDAFLAVIADSRSLRGRIDRLSERAQAVLHRLLAAGLQGCSINDFGVSGFQVSSFLRFGQAMKPDPAVEALAELTRFGLIYLNEYENEISLWREVFHSLNGRLYDRWPESFFGSPIVVGEEGARPPACTGVFGAVLRVIGNDPLIGLKSGGIGVKTYRSIAKRINQSESAVVIAITVGRQLGLIEEQMHVVGRGRNGAIEHRFALVPDAYALFAARPIHEEWRQMVMVWLGEAFEGNDVLFGEMCRQILADLVALPVDGAIAEVDVMPWIELRHALARTLDLESILSDLRSLDLVEPNGPLRLTSLGRVLLTDPEMLAEQFPALDQMFVVQGDQTVVSPPGLDPELRSRLEAIAVLTSDSSVRVYRLDPSKIASELSGTETASTIIDFLSEHSSVPLPPSIDQLIHDTERQRAGLTIASAATIVTASDVLGLAAAVRVKAAALTLIAPTVAISSLTSARVTAALRAKGLAPTVAGSTAATGTSKPLQRHMVKPPTVPRKLKPVLLAPAALADLARTIA